MKQISKRSRHNKLIKLEKKERKKEKEKERERERKKMCKGQV